MLISDVINGWGNNGEGLAINNQLRAKKKWDTLQICLTLWGSWVEKFPCYYPHASLSQSRTMVEENCRRLQI